MNVIVPKPENAEEVRQWSAKFEKQHERVQVTAAIKVLGCLSTTKNAALRAEPGLCPYRITRDDTSSEQLHIVKNIPNTRLQPYVADRYVWEYVMKKWTIRLDGVVDVVWKCTGDGHEEVFALEKFGWYKTIVNWHLELSEGLR